MQEARIAAEAGRVSFCVTLFGPFGLVWFASWQGRVILALLINKVGSRETCLPASGQ